MSQRKRVDLEAGLVLYAESGNGDPIVFVHGVFVNGNLWRSVIDELGGSYRCIAPDWPLGSHSEAMRNDADLCDHRVLLRRLLWIGSWRL